MQSLSNGVKREKKDRKKGRKDGRCVRWIFYFTWRDDIRQCPEAGGGVREVPEEDLPAPVSPHGHVRHAGHGDRLHPGRSPAQVSLYFTPPSPKSGEV